MFKLRSNQNQSEQFKIRVNLSKHRVIVLVLEIDKHLHLNIICIRDYNHKLSYDKHFIPKYTPVPLVQTLMNFIAYCKSN